jgi:hypothetical protein
MEKPVTCSIVIPVYNSAESLEMLVAAWRQALPRCRRL